MTYPILDVPAITADQMATVDRIMVEEYWIDLARMMENAGRSLAALARSRFLGGNAIDQTVVALAGSGGNGGGVLAAARHLHNWGADVRVILTRPPEAVSQVVREQAEILHRMDLPLMVEAHPSDEDLPVLILDGIIGYNLTGSPRDTAAELIHWANAAAAPVLSLDVPSGLDATTGAAASPTVRATATLTLALPKMGLLTPAARDFVGELYLADIGVPPALYGRSPLSLEIGPIFGAGEIVRIKSPA